MNEKQFTKYLEKVVDKVYKKTEKFYKKYPEYNITGDAEGYLYLTLFKGSLSFGNSASAEKRITIYKDKERENGKWRKL